MSRFLLEDTGLSGLTLARRKTNADTRGTFSRLYCSKDLEVLFEGRSVVQSNLSLTNEAATVRGIHFQKPPHAECKLITCLRGKVWDVAVDLRANSPTFLKWHAIELSSENAHAVFIPEGFGHGFQTLTDDSELLYFHTAAYEPGSEGAINPLDSSVAIDWPLPVSVISERDASHPFLDSTFTGIHL